jgi:hypothetical protein
LSKESFIRLPAWALLACAATLAVPTFAAGGPQPSHQRVEVAPAKTSIYIGSVSLATAPFVRRGNTYVSTYSAKVFPYFVFNERGMIVINATEDQVSRLVRGNPVLFDGRAVSDDGDHRRIECLATPAHDASGRIKVRVSVAPGIGLTFNTTYKIFSD